MIHYSGLPDDTSREDIKEVRRLLCLRVVVCVGVCWSVISTYRP